MAVMVEMPGRGPCPDCEIMIINGVRCHEFGCPNAWQDIVRECLFCDQDFRPTFREQACCSEECNDAFH